MADRLGNIEFIRLDAYDSVKRTVNKEIDDFTNDYWYFLLSSSLLYSFELYSQWTNARKKLVRIRVMEENHSRVSFRAIFKRYGLLYLIYVSATRINVLFTPFIQSTNQMLVLVSLLVVLIFGLINLDFIATSFGQHSKTTAILLRKKNGYLCSKHNPAKQG